MDEEQKEHFIVPYSTYLIIWAGLIILTGITIWVAGLHLGKLSILGALGIATIKAGLVLAFFMHLRYEKMLFKLMLVVPILTLATILGLTFLDIGYR